MILQRAIHLSLLLLLLQLGASPAASQRLIVGTASAGNYIHAEEEVDFSAVGYRAKINITSDVPVTVQRYSKGGDGFLMGQQPVPENMAKVLVTSNCDTSETANVVPDIVVSKTGSITVTLGVTEEDANAMKFLAPSSYSAFWTWFNDFCGFNPAEFAIPDDGCPEGQCLDPDGVCSSASCTPDAPVLIEEPWPVLLPGEPSCDSFAACYEEGSTCARGTESCCGDTYDSLKCDCANIDGSLQYMCFFTDACLRPSCCGSGPPADKPPPADGTCAIGELCKTGIDDDYCCDYYDELGGTGTYCSKSGGSIIPAIEMPGKCEVGPNADPAKACGAGEFCELDTGACNSESAVYFGLCAEIPDMCNGEWDPVCGCDGRTHSNVCKAHSSGFSVSRIGECDPPLIDELPSKCEVAFDADPATACGMGEFCELDTGACNSKSAVHSGLCAETPEMCTEEWDPVCGCDGRTHSNVCKARSAGTSISGMGACASDVPTNQPTNVPTNLPTVQPTTLATAESVKAEPTTGPISSTLPPTSNPTGPPSKEATEMPSKSPIGASTSTSSLTGSPSKETPASVATTVTSTTAATSSEGTATSAATTDASTTGTTTVSTAATTASFAIDGDFPTKAPSTKLSNSEVPTPPPNWWEEQEDLDRATSPNSAFNHSRSFLFYVATTFMAIVFVSVILPGNGGNNNLWGFGKFAVAAMAVSSLYSKRFPASKGGSIRKNNHKGSESFPAPNQRALQKICTYNVEILIDGCAHPLEISAPSGRVVDVVIEDLESEQRPDDSCVTDYQATLNFTVTDEKDVLDLKANGTVDTLPQWGFQCLQAVAGRPFVDATGGSLQAIPWVPDDEAESMISALSWTGEALMETHASSISNATSRGRFLLGEDWIQRALGEHASVASFSAFSIALMSNQAPSDLVEDALKAGLDEVRHSRISFDIASKLTGKEVGPGPLPESKLEFGQDLKALALAVAREGCVDETLSTFAAAVEVKHITDVLNEGVQDTPYSSIDRDLLAFIRNALVTIAMDESNHSALAWRTLNWVCSVDRNVCDAVYMDVFEESNLEMRFKQRAASLFGETSSVLHSMRGEWKKIFKAHQGKPVPESICNDDDMVHVGEDQSGQPLLTSVTESVLRQVSCI
eukprot:CAMPEP_0201987656 /NCGR_PEP_ID=MMETSP0904-20121228/91909_1 /ASSEMBLY_ACC=CAM_ASM_000553 /TAXON_ID=420261 /ORGANISM="Thalassiosira antarctica, Strain CCMP982" /LENGTH=1137 /DNA_ID=CAMNT_0048541777 /DNA_START=72 /DNA_END=3485 /DNA_ORIENTATION=-